MKFRSKLPNVTTHIFSEVTGLSKQYNAINMSQGFPNFEPSQVLQDLVDVFLKKGTSQYAPMPGLPILRERIAEKIEASYGVNIDPESEVTITIGATEGIFNCIAGFVYPGDEVILIEPCFDCYRPLVEIAGGIPVIYKMKPPEFKIGWDELATLITDKTRMICINTPNNPTGSILTKEDMLKLVSIIKDTNVFIMSDEVYEHMIYDNEVHESPLKYPELRERTFAMFSFGKTYHITGWKVGYCIAPPDLTREIRKVHQNSVYSVSHTYQAALAEFMKRPEEYLQLPTFYQQKRDLFLNVTANSRFKVLPCLGTYFQLFDYSAISTESDYSFCKRLISEFGVAAIPISFLYSDREDNRIIRFCFAKTDDLIISAGKLLSAI